MVVLIALIPALAWGSIGLISGKLGGTPIQQTLGMTSGAVLFGLLTWFIYHPEMTAKSGSPVYYLGYFGQLVRVSNLLR